MSSARVEVAERELARFAISTPLVTFGRAMAELDGSSFDWPYYLEKPYKWAREYVAWKDNGEPRDFSEAGWESFADAVEELRR